MSTVAEIVLSVFDLATEYARKRVRMQHGIIDDPKVIRDDVEQAVKAMRFDLIELALVTDGLASPDADTVAFFDEPPTEPWKK